MTDPIPPAALREWRDHLGRPTVWIVCLCVAVLVALAGPFGTIDVLNLPGRLGYWGVIGPLSYAIGAFSGMVLVPIFAAALPPATRFVLSAVVTGGLIYLMVTALNAAFFGLVPTLTEIPGNLLVFVAFSLVIGYLLTLLPNGSSTTDSPPQPHQPAVLDRLPLDKRAALLSLSSEDHYTRIRTAKGQQMVLLRLADAIREASPEPGLQVHRSHWVALSAVAAARRDGDRAILTLVDGSEIPVSRANVPAIREAGLLPR